MLEADPKVLEGGGWLWPASNCIPSLIARWVLFYPVLQVQMHFLKIVLMILFLCKLFVPYKIKQNCFSVINHQTV